MRVSHSLQVVSKPNVIVKETIHLFAGTLSYSTRSASHVTYEEVLPPVHLKDGWIYVDEVLCLPHRFLGTD